MPHKIYPKAKRSLIEIWRYTDETWGENQADKYIRGLYAAIEKASRDRASWKPVEYELAQGIYFIRYQHHYVFFRQLSKGNIGIIGIFHERMDLPMRIKEAIEANP